MEAKQQVEYLEAARADEERRAQEAEENEEIQRTAALALQSECETLRADMATLLEQKESSLKDLHSEVERLSAEAGASATEKSSMQADIRVLMEQKDLAIKDLHQERVGRLTEKSSLQEGTRVQLEEKDLALKQLQQQVEELTAAGIASGAEKKRVEDLLNECDSKAAAAAGEAQKKQKLIDLMQSEIQDLSDQLARSKDER